MFLWCFRLHYTTDHHHHHQSHVVWCDCVRFSTPPLHLMIRACCYSKPSVVIIQILSLTPNPTPTATCHLQWSLGWGGRFDPGNILCLHLPNTGKEEQLTNFERIDDVMEGTFWNMPVSYRQLQLQLQCPKTLLHVFRWSLFLVGSARSAPCRLTAAGEGILFIQMVIKSSSAYLPNRCARTLE